MALESHATNEGRSGRSGAREGLSRFSVARVSSPVFRFEMRPDMAQESHATHDEPAAFGLAPEAAGAGNPRSIPSRIARVAELADARDLGSRTARCAGSTPVPGTTARGVSAREPSPSLP